MARKIVLFLFLGLAVCLVYGEGSDCELPKASGVCRGRFRSFFFDMQSHECRPFVYTGCGGNGNRFYSRDECQFACHYFLKLNGKNW